MAEFKCSEVKTINVGDKVFEIKTEEDNKHLKGYIFDSLAYRYIRAKEQMAEYEFIKDSKREHDKVFYQRQANRDIMRFIEILHEAIGEHD